MRHAPLVLTPQHLGGLVFERSTSRYLPFDADATRLLVELSHTPLPGVLARLSVDEAAAARAFYEAFEPRGFFTLDRRFAGHGELPHGAHLRGLARRRQRAPPGSQRGLPVGEARR